MTDLPSKWIAAKAAGLPRYFTGAPCKRGHIAERATRNGGCLECARCMKRQEDPVKKAERMVAWRAKNAEAIRSYDAERRC